MRRIFEENYLQMNTINGDTTTLADPSVVKSLVNEEKKYLKTN